MLAFTLGGTALDTDIHVMLNMSDDDRAFALPPLDHGHPNWYRAIDTALPSPEDIAEPGWEPRVPRDSYSVTSHSVVVLIAK